MKALLRQPDFRQTAMRAVLLLLFAPLYGLCDDTEAGKAGDDKEVALGVLTFFVVMVVIGLAVGMVVPYIRLPYTAVLIVIGAGLGVLFSHDSSGKLIGPGALAWMDISPDLFLSVFLPVLLFASAFSLEWHFVRKLFYEAIILAGPGVLLGGFLTALLVRYTFPYHWSWLQCLLFGSVLSATDPVAVAAVLSEAALPLKLQTIVNLEALLNDGSAFVVYTLLKTWDEGKHQNAGQSIRKLFQLAAGGPAIGLGFGVCTSFTLYLMHNKKVLEMLLTVASAYGAWIVADSLAGASGVLAVVAVGLWFCYKGLHHVSRPVENTLHELWELLEFLANTLVFILAGLIIAGKIYQSSNGSAAIQREDWGYAVLLWIYLTVIRFFLFVVATPFMNLRGYHLDARECTVMGWSGLRGAVGLALGLQIYGDQEIHDESFRNKQFFHIGCVAVLTILFQGSSMKLLLNLLGMTKPTQEKRRWMYHVGRNIEEHGNDSLKFAKYDHTLGEPQWSDVDKFVHTRQRRLAPTCSELSWLPCFAKKAEGFGKTELSAASFKTSREQRIQEKRSRFLKAVKQAYLNLFQDHFLASRHIFKLRVSVDADLDDLQTPLGDWEKLSISHKLQWRQDPMALISAWCLAHSPSYVSKVWPWSPGTFLQKALQDRVTLALAFCNAHQAASQQLEALERDSQAHLGDTEQPTDLERTSMSNSVIEEVMKESRCQVARAFDFVMDLKDGWPEALRGIKTSQLAREILNEKERYITDLKESGLLAPEEAQELVDLVYHNLRRLVLAGPHYDIPCPLQLLRKNQVFCGLSDTVLKQEVWWHVQVSTVQAGQVIDGLCSDAIPLLLRGKVSMAPVTPVGTSLTSDEPSRNRVLLGGGQEDSSGAVLAWDLFQQDIPCPWMHLAHTICLVAFIPKPILMGLVSRDADARAAVWQSVGVAIALWQSPNALPGDYNTQVSRFRSAQPRYLEKGSSFGEEEAHLVLLQGCFRRGSKEELIHQPGVYSVGGINGVFHMHSSNMKVLVLPPYDSPLPLASDSARSLSANVVAHGSHIVRPHSTPPFPGIELQDMRNSEVNLYDVEIGSAGSSEMDDEEVESILLNKQRKGLAHGLLIHSLVQQDKELHL